MKFISLSSTIGKARRAVSTNKVVGEQDTEDPRRLTEILRSLTSKLSELEAKTSPEATEFEQTVSTAGALVSLNHGFDCPVRWLVTSWKNAAGGHSLVWDSSSNSKVLVLKSYVAGTAVIRVEPSQYEIS